MAKENKNIGLIIAGAVVFAGIITTAIIMFSKKKEETSGENEQSNQEGTQNGQGGNAVANTITNIATNTKKAGYISEKPSNQYNLTVHFAVPRPAVGFVKKGSIISLTNFGKYNGVYPVMDTWTDDSGNLGAVYLVSKNVTSENSNNTSYDGTGLITKIS